jgi:hypothetical protein
MKAEQENRPDIAVKIYGLAHPKCRIGRYILSILRVLTFGYDTTYVAAASRFWESG